LVFDRSRRLHLGTKTGIDCHAGPGLGFESFARVLSRHACVLLSGTEEPPNDSVWLTVPQARTKPDRSREVNRLVVERHA
jgi:hypothetical protein